MKALQKLEIEAAVRELERKPNSALLWLEAGQETENAIRKSWAARTEAATTLMLALINVGDSQSEVEMFRRLVPIQHDIAHETHHELLTLRNELRTFWKEVSKERNHFGRTGEVGNNSEVAVILGKWWSKYTLDSEGWWIFWPNGTFYPSLLNFRGMVARIVFDRRRYLAICPGCDQFFIKRRDDGKYCDAVPCKKKGNNLRQINKRQRDAANKQKKGRKR